MTTPESPLPPSAEPSRFPTRTPILVLGVAILILIVSAWAFYTSDGATKARERNARMAEARSGSGDMAPTLEVEVEVVSAESRGNLIELSAVLEPVRSTWVAAEIAGTIVDVPAHEYAPIKAGDVLVELDDALPRADLIRAEANFALARAELRRQERLGSRSVASEAELDAAKAEERRSFAALLEARTRLGHTRIKAPFDGLVNSLDLDRGAYVQPGTPIAEVLDTSVLEVTVLVGDRQVTSVTPGDRARVQIDALGNETRDARIVRVGRAPRDGGQRYPVVVALDNEESAPPPEGDAHDEATSPTEATTSAEENRPRAGMLARVRFEVGSTPSIQVPSGAIQNEFELDYVYVLDENDVAHRVRVSTRPVPFRPDRVEIRKGLSPGDRVCVSAIDQLHSGRRVIPR